MHPITLMVKLSKNKNYFHGTNINKNINNFFIDYTTD